MTFDEILEHVLEMLQRRGRVSYRALKRQFDLDDAYLEDLKAEIVECAPGGRGSGWHHAGLDRRRHRAFHASRYISPRRASFWHRSTAGSPRGLILQTFQEAKALLEVLT